jgi:hypothetical protein
VLNQKTQEEERATPPQPNSRTSPNNKQFDFEVILNAILPLVSDYIIEMSFFYAFYQKYHCKIIIIKLSLLWVSGAFGIRWFPLLFTCIICTFCANQKI